MIILLQVEVASDLEDTDMGTHSGDSGVERERRWGSLGDREVAGQNPSWQRVIFKALQSLPLSSVHSSPMRCDGNENTQVVRSLCALIPGEFV